MSLEEAGEGTVPKSARQLPYNHENATRRCTYGLASGRCASVGEDELVNLERLVSRDGTEGVHWRHDACAGWCPGGCDTTGNGSGEAAY